MKKVIVTTLIFIVLGTVWTLFLEREKRRFVDSLPKVPTTVTQPVNTADMSAASETGESADAAGSLPDASAAVEETPDAVELAPLHPHPHADSLVPPEEAEVSFEELPDADETPLDSDTKDSFAAFLEPLGMSEAEYERRERATETVRRITNNPKNWVKGRPGEVGFMFVLTGKENWEFIEANNILLPSEGNRKALENLRSPPAQKFPAANPEVSEILRFGNYELRIHKPIR